MPKLVCNQDRMNGAHSIVLVNLYLIRLCSSWILYIYMYSSFQIDYTTLLPLHTWPEGYFVKAGPTTLSIIIITLPLLQCHIGHLKPSREQSGSELHLPLTVHVHVCNSLHTQLLINQDELNIWVSIYLATTYRPDNKSVVWRGGRLSYLASNKWVSGPVNFRHWTGPKSIESAGGSTMESADWVDLYIYLNSQHGLQQISPNPKSYLIASQQNEDWRVSQSEFSQLDWHNQLTAYYSLLLAEGTWIL